VLHHAALLRPNHIARAAGWGCGSVLPLPACMRWATASSPGWSRSSRMDWLDPIGAVQRAGIPFTLHHDNPMGFSPSLIEALWNAVNRTTRSGTVVGP